MGKLVKITEFLQSKNQFKIYLSIFRIILVFIVGNKILTIWSNQDILFSNESFKNSENIAILNFTFFKSPISVDIKYLLLFTILLLIFLLFGIGRKITSLLLYLSFMILQSYISPLLNGGDNLLTFILLYFIFTNSFEYLSLFSNANKHSNTSNIISNISVYCILIHLCYVYLISGIHKLHSDVWFNGTAIYYILSIERFQSPLCYLIKNNGFIVTISTYVTIFFEIFFCVLIWQKNTRNAMLFIGVFLHMGIFFFMMIFDFEIIFISIYGFFFTNNEWKKTINKIINLPIIRKYA